MSLKMKLTTKALGRLSKEPPTKDVFDTEISGFHLRPGSRGLMFRLVYRSRIGKQRVMTIGRYGHITAVQARDIAKKALAAVAMGEDPRENIEQAKVAAEIAETEVAQRQTLRTYLEGPYTDYQNRRKDGAGTLARIRRDFNDWLDLPMIELARSDVEFWQSNEEKKEKPKAFQTIKRSYGALKALLTHAAKRDAIAENPLKSVYLQKPAMNEDELAECGSERRYLEQNEIQQFFSGLDTYQEEKRVQRRNSRAHGKAFLSSLDDVNYVDHVKPWLLMMFYTGFRPGDLFGLRWEHIDLERATIRKVIEKTAHHKPEPRTFPICKAVVHVLTKWWKLNGSVCSGLVFPSPVNGKRMASSAMRKPWVRVKKLAGLPDDLVMYSLRHNFASQLVMGGVDLLTVSQLMAHSSIETTIKFYGHLAPDHKREAVEKFSRRCLI